MTQTRTRVSTTALREIDASIQKKVLASEGGTRKELISFSQIVQEKGTEGGDQETQKSWLQKRR